MGEGGGGFQPLCQSSCNSNCNTIIVKSDIPQAPHLPSQFLGEEERKENKRYRVMEANQSQCFRRC